MILPWEGTASSIFNFVTDNINFYRRYTLLDCLHDKLMLSASDNNREEYLYQREMKYQVDIELTTRKKVLLEKRVVAQLVMKFLDFMECKISLPCSQEYAIGPEEFCRLGYNAV
jgi:hypothetical protein